MTRLVALTSILAAQRKEAARHRTVAASLLRAERAACQGLGEDEMSHSPFFHREDILRAEEVYCPLMIAPTTVTVEDLGGVIAVTVMARRDREIAAVVGGANDLLAPAPP